MEKYMKGKKIRNALSYAEQKIEIIMPKQVHIMQAVE